MGQSFIAGGWSWGQGKLGCHLANTEFKNNSAPQSLNICIISVILAILHKQLLRN